MNIIIKNQTDNDNYTDGFPVGDNTTKKDGVESRDPSRPFDSDREAGSKKNKVDNSTGTTMNEDNKYKK